MSIVVMYAIALFILYTLQEYLSLQYITLIFFLHTFVFLYRAYYLSEYNKKYFSINDTKSIKKWLHIFQSGSFFASIAWGSLLYLVGEAPLEYKVLILTIIIGLAAIGMSTLGSILSVYLSFLFPMLGLALTWIFIHYQDNQIYENMPIPFIVLVLYLIMAALKFNKNYKQRFLEENRANLLNERIELALDGSSTSILDWDVRNNKLFISESWKKLLGFSDTELSNEPSAWKDRMHPDDRKQFFSSLKEHFKEKREIYESIHRLYCKNGSYIWVFERARIFYDKEGNPYRLLGTHTDITARKKVEADAVEKKKFLEESQRIAHIGSWKYDLVKDRLTWSDEIYKIFEVDKDVEPRYELVLEKTHPDDREMVDKAYTASLRTGIPYEITHRLLFKNGRIKYVKEACETSFDIDGKALVSIGTAQDITKQKLLENMLYKQKEVLSHLAHYDTLTELPNRTLLNDRLYQAIQKAKRNKTKFAVLFVDLDHFKEINDSLGHNVGDEVLQEVARRFKSIIREEDTLSRLGGDEFTVIMENLKQEQDASLLALKLLDVLSKTIIKGDNVLYISCSIGISFYPSDGDSVQDLLKYADAAMYKAKEEGRNNFKFYSSEMTMLAFERVVMEASIRSGLQNKEFEAYYQPQVNGIEDKIIGMEALVRWNHPTMGLVFPSKFIPLAESTGLIVKLDRYIMKTAIQQLSKWYKDGLNPGILALNLSMQQLKQKDFIKFIKNLFEETKCKPEWVEFEVTESQIMTNIKEAIEILRELSCLGATIAVDDFGTGYSSLSYLKKLPIDKLKIDQSFVRELPKNEDDAAITQAVIALAKSLKLDIIAEGVETEEQKKFLIENGCFNIQGYYYSKAISKEEFEKKLMVLKPF